MGGETRGVHRPSLLPPLVVILLIPAALLVLGYWLAPGVVDDLTVEDGPIEYLQAVLFAVGAVALLAAAVRRRSDPWAWILGVGLFFVAGEEISWGQRIFGVDTPESFRRNNVQEEMNLHNLGGIHGNVRAIGFIVILTLFVVLPLAQARSRRLRQVSDRLRLPDVPLWAVPLAVTAVLLMLVPRLLGNVVFALDEVGELYVALTSAGFAVSVAGLAAHLPGLPPLATARRGIVL